MAYLATWGIFIQEDGLDPFEVAHRAKQRMHEPCWRIIDLETGVITLIDVDQERVIYQSEPDRNRPTDRHLSSDS